jgi:trk system potassium uptake protein TrkH
VPHTPTFPGLATVLYALGWQLAILAGAMLAPLAVDLSVGNADWLGFAGASATSFFAGLALVLASRRRRHELSLRAAFLLTTASWFVVAAFSALPFELGRYGLPVTDSVFEAVSGLTTTGATVLTGLDTAPPGLLLWRSLLQWIGGIGIVVMALVLLPFLRIGGMQLFRSESSDRTDKVLPTTAGFVARLIAIYLALTATVLVALMVAGLDFFEALNHALTAVATGGFSTRDASIAAFRSPAVEIVLLFAMIAASLPYSRYVALLSGRRDLFLRDTQIRRFLLFLAGVSVGLAAWLVVTTGRGPLDALLAAAFAVVSVVTTTGYVVEDWSAWGEAVVPLFLLLTVVGGCTGSTAGGIKIFRFEILWLAARQHLEMLFVPRRVTRPRYDGRPVGPEVVLAVAAFVFLFAVSWATFSILLGLVGLDPVTAVSAAATALGNVGPGLGDIVGPAGNFRPLGDAAKWLLILAMLLGRLEFFTLLVLLHPGFWRW